MCAKVQSCHEVKAHIWNKHVWFKHCAASWHVLTLSKGEEWRPKAQQLM